MIIDVIFILLLIVAVFRGLSKGLILGVFSLFAFIIGIAAAMKLSVLLANSLQSATGSSNKWLPALSFVLVFILVIWLVRLGAKLIEKTIQFAMLGWLNRIGGVVLYAALYTLIFSIFLFYMEKMMIISPETIQSSQSYTYISPWGPKVIDNLGKIIPWFKDMFTELQEFFGRIASKAG